MTEQVKFLEKDYFKGNIPFFYGHLTKPYKPLKNQGMHTHEFYEVFLTLTDDFLHIVGDKYIRIPKGTLVFIRPWDSHANWIYGEDNTYLQIGYTKSVAENLFSYMGSAFDSEKMKAQELPPSFCLSSKDYDLLYHSFRRIEIFDAENSVELEIYFKKLIFSIYADYFVKYNKVENEEADIPRWLKKVYKKTREEKLFIEGMDAVVRESDKTYQHIARSLKRYYNQTPSEFILELRLNYAYNLISTSNIPITDICYSAGFNNVSYFNKKFIERYEKTPRKIRKEYLSVIE